MYRIRLRPSYTSPELAEIYKHPHDSRRWEDHKIRVRQTVSLGKEAYVQRDGLIADLSCGNATIPVQLSVHFGARTILGDFAPTSMYELRGPIERTLHMMGQTANLFILSETLEHLDDPDTVLQMIRQKSAQLLLSTPIGESTSGNPEHYWGWDQEAVGAMLDAARWKPIMRTDLIFSNPDFCYNYQIWLCR